MKILVLDDNDDRLSWFKTEVPADCTLDIAKTAAEAIALLAQNVYGIICLDHDLDKEQPFQPSGTGTGYEVAQHIKGSPNEQAEIIVHSYNPAGVKNILSLLPNAKPLPFGTFTWNHD